MTREEERYTIAHKIAWEYTKHYDPLLSKESWCEMAARDAIDWADKHPKEGLWDNEKVKQFLRDNTMFGNHPAVFDEFIKSLIQYMEE